jgi:hypothetical protein
MSIVSIQSEDKSNFLCKRFASLATSYFDQPSAARSASAQVPLENLFRVLEMFRNDTFSDESRKGVLAFESPGHQIFGTTRDDTWYTNIQKAVQQSIVTTFGNNADQNEAAGELQRTLRWLVVDGDLPDKDAAVTRAKTFFMQLSGAL